MVAREAADLRSAGAGRVGGVDAIDVERDIDWLVFALFSEMSEMTLHRRHPLLVEFLGGDHADFVFARKIEIIFGVDLAAQTDLQHATVI